MITNCELPLQLLEQNYQLNDFDFVLFHLYSTNVKYREYYQQMRKVHPERLMILDNSAYEFFVKGETLDMRSFVKAIAELKPDYYILPDVLQNKNATLDGIKKFCDEYGLLISDGKFISRPMAVPQGKDSDELVECIYEIRSLCIDYIGIPFHLPFYQYGYVADDIRYEFYTTYGEENDDIRYAMGRVQWMRDHEELLKKFDKVHLLGSHCPLEKVFYKDYYSMDTGYPVKLGMEGIELEKEKGKPKTIIDDFLNSNISDEQMEMIRKNINKFKKY